MIRIHTVSGRAVDVGQPNASMIDLGDIVHALSHCCRFAGHVRNFYSVAQHSVLVSRLVDGLRYAYLSDFALLHDATEAYMCDIPYHLKHDEAMFRYRQLETQLERVIEGKFFPAGTITKEFRAMVKNADTLAVVFEHSVLRQDYRVDDWALKAELFVSSAMSSGFIRPTLISDITRMANRLPRPSEFRCWSPEEARSMFYNSIQGSM